MLLKQIWTHGMSLPKYWRQHSRQPFKVRHPTVQSARTHGQPQAALPGARSEHWASAAAGTLAMTTVAPIPTKNQSHARMIAMIFLL
ncbi:MAG TPA: hypothetical protein PKK06_00475 [Phycisphaerae bacterium]|nr:hypothetical protein [Phycisphaerae bacterium]HNU43917.1 hypothetical protein [Phycisphaerae bacterium]